MNKKNIAAIYPLSPLQEGILFHSLQAAEAGAYFQQFSCVLSSLENVGKWRSSWQLVAQKHPIMRTLFAWKNREYPLQIVRECVTLPWELLDWSDSTGQQQLHRWDSLLQRDRDRGFDITVAPLMRFTLIKVADNCYRFLWSFHHILLDGWSQRLLLNDALTIYQSSHTTQNVVTKAPPFSLFIDWLKHKDTEAEKLFWSRQLAGFHKPTNITDIGNNQGEGTPKVARSVCELRLQSDLVSKLQDVARAEHVTFNTLVLAAWSKILATECRSSDVVFGTTVAGRPVDLAGADRIAGLFINTLPCRVQLPENGLVAEWLRELQYEQARCRAYEQTSLANIQRWSELAPGTALFETILVFENLPASDSEIDNFAPTISSQQYVEFSHYPLAILADPSEGLTLIAVHQEDVISLNKAKILLKQVEAILSQLSRLAEQYHHLRINDLAVVSSEQCDLMLNVWDQADMYVSLPHCVHQRFEQWALTTPDAIALMTSNQTDGRIFSLTYRQLNRRANQLAHFLVVQGVNQHSLLAVLLERNAETIIAYLASLKLGAAYIPLDPDYPKERIEQILAEMPDSEYFLLSHSGLLEKVPENVRYRIFVDDEFEQIAGCEKRNLNIKVLPHDLAYVIYTSGSTGKPKGVMVEHQALFNSTMARTEFYPNQPDAFLLLSSFATDSSIAGLYWTMCTGSTLVLANKRLEQDLLALEKLIAKTTVSHLLCIPSLYQLILAHCDKTHLASLNTVIVAGEACSSAVLRQHQNTLPNVGLYNEYGPSEYTVWATAADLSRWPAGQFIPIGKPIANTQTYVLDVNQLPVPIGVIGELYLGGNSLARGYLGQSDKTAACFVNNPLQGLAGQRHKLLYKTGDLVRLHQDGNLEFIGRVDNQIKWRGFRIEPEEIETILASHPAVTEAVVFLDGGSFMEVQVETLITELAKLATSDAENLLAEVEQLTDNDVKDLLQ